MRSTLLFLLLLGAITACAQQSDLYLFDFVQDGEKWHLENPRFLSGFNPGGYTNQPEFIDPYRLLVSVGDAASPAETDLYEINLRKETCLRITQTADREYSPVLTTQGMVQCVLVDVANDDAQIIWEYPFDRSNGGQAYLPEAKDVGYFVDLGTSTAVFEVGSPNKLFLYNRDTGAKKFISNQIGRTLKRTSGGQLAYVHKFSDAYWYLKLYDLETSRTTILKKTLPECEYFEILPDDSFIMAWKSKLYRLDPKAGNEWTAVGDFDALELGQVSRMRYNGINQLAVITSKQ